MGRYNFRPQRVHQAVTQLLGTERLQAAPPWHDIVGTVPPSQILVRTQPVQHDQRSKTKKPSKLFRPQNITYPEDRLRKEFFSDHPWELARPRVVLENDGMDARMLDWSTGIRQPGQPISGESVIQRQSWLMHNVPKMTKARAYDQARQEFYEERLKEDVERRVAKEEAMATGAYFGKSMLQIGMELEDKEYERWKKWALQEITEAKQRQAAVYTGLDNPAAISAIDDPGVLASLEALENDTPATEQDMEESSEAKF